MEYLMALNKKNNETSLNQAIVNQIAEAIAGLDYGSVVIKVHSSRIVQIEVTQRKRFDDVSLLEKGGGI